MSLPLCGTENPELPSASGGARNDRDLTSITEEGRPLSSVPMVRRLSQVLQSLEGIKTWRVVTGLMLIALLARLVLVLKSIPPCLDAFYYYKVAEGLGEQEFQQALVSLNFNIYPWILLGVYRLGLNWVAAGIVLSIVASTLTIPPLYGWVRQMFDKKLAVITCLLFAFQPLFVFFGIDATREALFWLCYISTLYFTWTGAHHPNFWNIVGGGVAFAFAVSTRVEGWSLAIPLIAWPVIVAFRSRTLLWRVLFAPLSYMLILIGLMVVANVTLLRNHSRWEWGRLDILVDFPGWTARQLAAHGSDDAQNAQFRYGYIPPQERNKEFVVWLVKSITVPFIVFYFTGTYSDRKRVRQYEFLLLHLSAALLVVAVWVLLHEKAYLDGRYFLLSLVMVLPWCARGALIYYELVNRICQRVWPAFLKATMDPGTLATAMFLCGNVAILTLLPYTTRYEHRDLGRWLRQEYGPLDAVYVENSSKRIGFYAVDAPPRFSSNQWGSGPPPELAILELPKAPEQLQKILKYAKKRRMKIVEFEGLVTAKGGPTFVFLIRSDVLARGNPANLVASESQHLDSPLPANSRFAMRIIPYDKSPHLNVAASPQDDVTHQ